MQVPFYKYQGTGNDFILIDNRTEQVSGLSSQVIAQCCNRRLGIGGDGLMLLQTKEGFDFEMIYYNADGKLGSMCGNGGRCIVAFAHFLGILKTDKAYFLAVDGPHVALVKKAEEIELQMTDVPLLNYNPKAIFLNTGSPHFIEFVEQLEDFDVYNKGRAIRYNDTYKKEGTNVNFVEILGKNSLHVATYERGVEDETLSCGTGVTAAAIAYHQQELSGVKKASIQIQTKGGKLVVNFDNNNNYYSNIWLCGPAKQVFGGNITL